MGGARVGKGWKGVGVEEFTSGKAEGRMQNEELGRAFSEAMISSGLRSGLFAFGSESGRGLPQSKTLSRSSKALGGPPGLGVRPAPGLAAQTALSAVSAAACATGAESKLPGQDSRRAAAVMTR